MKVKILGQEVDLLIGMDAEFFIERDGQVIAAARVIPGLKTAPHQLENGVCHPDGISLEVGAPPSDTPEGMITNLFKVLAEVQEKYLTPNGCVIGNKSEVQHALCVGVEKEDLAFGCGAEFDAYATNGMIKRVQDTNRHLRFSGFHIHLGFTQGLESNYFTYLDTRRLVKVLDAAFLQVNLNTSDRRATQYGGRGAFRIKPYGIEYRMMDCSVITDSRKLERLLAVLNRLPDLFDQAGGGL